MGYFKDGIWYEDMTISELRFQQKKEGVPSGLTIGYDARDSEFFVEHEDLTAWSADGEYWVIYRGEEELDGNVDDETFELAILAERLRELAF